MLTNHSFLFQKAYLDLYFSQGICLSAFGRVVDICGHPRWLSNLQTPASLVTDNISSTMTAKWSEEKENCRVENVELCYIFSLLRLTNTHRQKMKLGMDAGTNVFL